MKVVGQSGSPFRCCHIVSGRFTHGVSTRFLGPLFPRNGQTAACQPEQNKVWCSNRGRDLLCLFTRSAFVLFWFGKTSEATFLRIYASPVGVPKPPNQLITPSSEGVFSCHASSFSTGVSS